MKRRRKYNISLIAGDGTIVKIRSITCKCMSCGEFVLYYEEHLVENGEEKIIDDNIECYTFGNEDKITDIRNLAIELLSQRVAELEEKLLEKND